MLQHWGLLMEGSRDPNTNGKRSFPWLPEMDQILLVGMKHGLPGIHEATASVLRLRPGLTRADCWKRLRYLRENGNANHPDPHNWPEEIQQLLCNGYGEGGRKKREAIKAVRELYPGLPGRQLRRFVQQQGWLPGAPRNSGTLCRPWSEQEERKLWELAGYEPASKIARRLGRSEGAVRFRMKALGLSVRVKDGWSFRSLQQMLRVGPSKLRRFVADGLLRVRDPRISTDSLGTMVEQFAPLPKAARGIAKALLDGPQAYSWKHAARFLGVTVEQVREWIAKGKLKVVDTFVTDRAFEAFCKICGPQLNPALLSQSVRDWLVEEYELRVSSGADTISVPVNEKHALVTRQCPKCQRPMRGNIFFRHLKNCKGLIAGSKRKAPQRIPNAKDKDLAVPNL
ncbi:MAG: hypothetical protein WBW85_07780 [Terriglobales bacterium]